jgi:hypothetical protein
VVGDGPEVARGWLRETAADALVENTDVAVSVCPTRLWARMVTLGEPLRWQTTASRATLLVLRSIQGFDPTVIVSRSAAEPGDRHPTSLTCQAAPESSSSVRCSQAVRSS